MANGQGGARIGAGRKKKVLADNIAEGNPGKCKLNVVDPIIPHRGDPVLPWDRSNWQPLRKDCHDRKTGFGLQLKLALRT